MSAFPSCPNVLSQKQLSALVHCGTVACAVPADMVVGQFEGGRWSRPPYRASGRLGAASEKLHSSISRDISRDQFVRRVASAQVLPFGTEAAISRDLCGGAAPARLPAGGACRGCDLNTREMR